MDKSKDHMITYVLKSYVLTMGIAFVSMVSSLISFYQCHMLEAVRRVLLYDLYTTLYFLLIWILNYIIFELSVILYDMYKNKVKWFYSLVICALCGIVALNIPMLDLFRYNFSLLALLVFVRIFRHLIKDKKIIIKRPWEWSILKKKDC